MPLPFAIPFISFIKQYWKVFAIALILGATYFAGVNNTTNKYEAKIQVIENAHQQQVIDAQSELKKKTDQYDKEKIYIAEAFEEYRRTHPVIKTKEVKIYVTPEADANCTINLGFIRLHNAAASGSTDLPSVNDGEQSNDSPTKLALSSVGEVVAENYNRCLLEFEKIKALQATIRKYQEINE